MFNGIIKNTGRINKIYRKNNNCFLEISSKIKFTKKEIGSSVSCSGACLTLEKFNKNLSKFYISNETLKKTVFKSSKKVVNSKLKLNCVTSEFIGYFPVNMLARLVPV